MANLKVLVAVKRVIDYNVHIRVKADNSGVETENVRMSMNPFDEIGVEQAIRMKEQGLVDEIVVVTIGVEKCRDTLLAALAMGADRGILVTTDEPNLEPLGLAKTLKAVVEKEQPDLVIAGKQAIDNDHNQTGQMLAAMLDWSQATFVSDLQVSGREVTATREVDSGSETIKFSLPAVVTTDLRLNEPRYASLPNIMKAKKKPIDAMALSDLGVDASPRMKILSVTPPPTREGGEILDSVDELVTKLKTRKVIS